ncbi:MAG: glycosyltransferase [Candidatus Hydrogenedens sp.]|nr:glycosyltransferase [Candidatus Hydrogenedentota bacterium]NLF57120.1 glycosyltransferase [Candidatus Hydrogenedens sp.]
MTGNAAPHGAQDTPPGVSVVVAVWAGDAPGPLRDALESVRAQSFAGWECLIGADGPLTPELDAVIGEFTAVDGRFRRVDHPGRRGPAAARNRILPLVRGEFIAVLDADDAAEPRRLERQLARMTAPDAPDVLGAWCLMVDAGGAPLGLRRTPSGPGAVRRALWRRNPLAHSSVMLRTALLRDNPYPETRRFGEDHLLWVRLAAKGARLDNLPEVLCRYRIAPLPKDHGTRRDRFRADWATRREALRLLPSVVAALCLPAAFLLSAARLLPPGLLGRLRGLLARGGGGDTP